MLALSLYGESRKEKGENPAVDAAADVPNVRKTSDDELLKIHKSSCSWQLIQFAGNSY
jgi:hypothetical protein